MVPHDDVGSLRSHPTWVRGLKLYSIFVANLAIRSHPTWVRGLKQSIADKSAKVNAVAPYVGAWIETSRSVVRYAGFCVAPYVGAWIETCHHSVFRGAY